MSKDKAAKPPWNTQRKQVPMCIHPRHKMPREGDATTFANKIRPPLSRGSGDKHVAHNKPRSGAVLGE